MFPFSSKRQIDLSDVSNSSEEFINITHHYDESTLLTQNAELIQVIKIEGTTFFDKAKLSNLKNTLRRAIWSQKECENYAFWLHTVKFSKDVTAGYDFENIFAKNINEICDKQFSWKKKYIVEMYLTVIYRPPNTLVQNLNSYFNSIRFTVIKKFYDDFFTANSKKISEFTLNIVDSLKEFNAFRLQVQESSDGSLRSPLLNFLYRIIKFRDVDVAISKKDIAHELAFAEHVVSSDVIEVVSGGKRSFLSIISPKDYSGSNENAFLEFLKLPVESVITEIFYFSDKNDIENSFAHTKYIEDISGGAGLQKLQKMDALFNPNAKYISHQTSITIVSDSKNSLNTDLLKASNALSNNGIIHVVEDINLEQFFWAQIPGNFTFLRKIVPGVIEDVGDFMYLPKIADSTERKSLKKYTTIFSGLDDNYHYFSLEDKSCLAIMGSARGGKSFLANFLIAQESCHRKNILSIVRDDSSKIFIESIGGICRKINPDNAADAKKMLKASEISGFNIIDLEKEEKKAKIIHDIVNNFCKKEGSKLLFIDDILKIFDIKNESKDILKILDICKKNSVCLIVNIGIEILFETAEIDNFKILLDNFTKKIILPSKDSPQKLTDIFDISYRESQILSGTRKNERNIMIDEAGGRSICTFDLGESSVARRILSATAEDLNIYKNLKLDDSYSQNMKLDYIIKAFSED